jgi:hypothetical protein
MNMRFLRTLLSTAQHGMTQFKHKGQVCQVQLSTTKLKACLLACNQQQKSL